MAAHVAPYKDAAGDVLRLSLRQLAPAQLDQLKALLREHLAGFRQAYGRSAGAA